MSSTGGSIELEGVSLVIPSGALAAPTEVCLESLTDAPPQGYQTYSTSYAVSPRDVQLQAPARIEIPCADTQEYPALFWSRPTSTGYERLPSRKSQGIVSAEITTLGAGFVANGVDYVDPPDLSCVVTRLVSGRTLSSISSSSGETTTSSTVALFFAVDDCQGRPVTGLSQSDFVLSEDGTPLSVESAQTVLPQRGSEIFISLVLDMSSSTRPNLGTVVAAAKSFVTDLQLTRALPVHISLQLFAGEPTLTEWQPPTLDTSTLLARLDALPTYTAADASSTNLYGAVTQALNRQRAAKQAFEARNYGGVFTSGYVVVFTDGADTAGRSTLADVRAAQATNPDSVVSVVLATADYDAAAANSIDELSSVVLTSLDPQSLLIDFGDLAARIAGQTKRLYLLGYCSPKRQGAHTVTVEVSGSMHAGVAEYAFSAAGFGPGCDLAAFSTICDGFECGGLACGACDDRESKCDGDTFSCTNFCVTAGLCSGDVITNEHGYEQACFDRPEATRCDGACVDLRSNNDHCGTCGNQCVDASCFQGACAQVVAEVSGGNAHTCAVMAHGAVYCWGENSSGQLGIGTTVDSSTPVRVPGITNAVQVSAGIAHTCVLLEDTTVRCWGANGGRLGNGSPTSTTSPVGVRVPNTTNNMTGFARVVAGDLHSCGLMTNGTVRCWGSLGGSQTVLFATDVAGIAGATDIDTRYRHTCVRLTSSALRCWGENTYGALGNGTTTTSTSPVAVSGIATATRVSTGSNHTCALLADGTLRCWGINSGGPLGDGTVTNRTTPVMVNGITNAAVVDAGGQHSCAVVNSTALQCWGLNSSGQVGDGSTTARFLPTSVGTTSAITSVSAGSAHTCATTLAGGVECWGANASGQLGNGTTVPSSSPVPVLF